MIVDVSKDGTKVLSFDGYGSFYRPHDGGEVIIMDCPPTILKQHHHVACVKRDNPFDDYGMIMPAFTPVVPEEWTVMDKVVLRGKVG